MWPDLPRLASLHASDVLLGFTFYYPLFMAWVWIVGGLWFYLRHERPAARGPATPPPLEEAPPCSILIPCFNEEENLEDTVAYALRTRYPDFEVIAVNDGSGDGTGPMLDRLVGTHSRLRVIHLTENQGKAVALRVGAAAARHDYLVCIDGDAMLHPHAVHWMMEHLVHGSRVGAVTGNPRIHNRSSLLGKVQVGEFSSIIGLIKRAQRTYGRIFTVSGVIAAFSRAALQRVGYWNDDMATEDVDISWRLQMDHWDIRYEPKALCYIYMPETLAGLWRQRLRWARGGVEVLLRYGRDLLGWRARRFWGVALEHLASVTWSYAMLIVVVLFLLGRVMSLPPEWRVPTLLPTWAGVLLGMTCLIQFLVSLWLDRIYEASGFLRNFFWVIWYPLLYWVLSMLTVVVAVPGTLLARRRTRARWAHVDRGIHADNPEAK